MFFDVYEFIDTGYLCSTGPGPEFEERALSKYRPCPKSTEKGHKDETYIGHRSAMSLR